MPLVRVDFITNQAPHYRAALWKKLIDDDGLDPCFLFGEGSGKSIREIDFDDPCWRGRRERFRRVRNVYLRGVLIWQRGTLRRVLKTDAEALVLLGQMYILSMWLVAFIARRRGIRVLFWGHGAYGREGAIKRWFIRRFLSLADGVLVYGNHARKLLIADGLDAERLRVVYNSLDHAKQTGLRESLIDPEFISRQGWFKVPSAPLLLFVGRLTRQKSLDKLISSVAQLREQGRQFNLLFVGDGPKREQLQERAKSLRGKVHFYGACYNEQQLGRLIANADLCVSPGEVGLTAIHALSFGTPVCTHDRMEIQMPEAEAIIPGETGILFSADKMDISSAIRSWFDERPDRSTVQRACHKVIDAKWNTENQARIISHAIAEIGRDDSGA